MIRQLSFVLLAALGAGACSSSSDTPSSSTPTDGGGATDGSTSSPADGGTATTQDSGGSTTATNGTVHVTYNLDNAGEQSFDCVAEHRTFNHSTIPGRAGQVSIGCQNGAPGLDVIEVGVGVPDQPGTYNEGQYSAVTFQKGTLQIYSGAAAKAANPPEHTVTLTTWDATTGHAVGEGDLPAYKGNGNSTSSHTLTMKISFDVTTTEVK